jgi:FMN-dependent oxidoreductase (nitrilotriacetate monooxygenase family)
VTRARLVFSAFTGLGLPNHGPGLWRHPDARPLDHNDLASWTALARRLEHARFDMVFFGDSVGVPDVYRGSPAQALIDGIGIPSGDPSVLISALAAATSELGLTFTSSTLQEHPFNFARKLSTLDHLSKGRVGWNIVTGYAASAARNFGLEELPAHDQRYVEAEEYMDVVYKLWEGSWEDGAVLRDARRRVYADPDRVHPIDHRGPYFRVAGPQLPEPSPQRTPLLFQAGSSDVGRSFAARHAEGVFQIARNPQGARAFVSDVRGRARGCGRRDADLIFLQGIWFVIGDSEEAARTREAELIEWASGRGVLADLSAKLGVDLGDVDLDTPIDELRVPGVQGIVDSLRDAGQAKTGTFRDLTSRLLGARMVGAPEQIADRLRTWAAAGVDGFNVMDTPGHGAFDDFAEHLAPVLAQRGLMQREYARGTLREKLFGAGPQLPSRHPARAHRRPARAAARVPAATAAAARAPSARTVRS